MIKFNWVKISTYSLAASTASFAIIIPTYTYFNLLKKSEDLDRSLKKSEEELNQANEILKEAKKIEEDNSNQRSNLEAETQSIKTEKSNLVSKSTAVIGGIEKAFKTIKENYDRWFGRGQPITTWQSKMDANEKLIQELEKLLEDNK